MEIGLDFIVGGGPHLTFDFRIRGGPFDGHRIELAPVRAARFLAYGRFVSTNPAEWDRTLGPAARPCVVRLSGDEHLLRGPEAWAILDEATRAVVSAKLDDMAQVDPLAGAE